MKTTSNYARKHAYCARNGVWGFDVPEPKPWKRKASVEGAITQSNRPCRYAADILAKIEAWSLTPRDRRRRT